MLKTESDVSVIIAVTAAESARVYDITATMKTAVSGGADVIVIISERETANVEAGETSVVTEAAMRWKLLLQSCQGRWCCDRSRSAAGTAAAADAAAITELMDTLSRWVGGI